MGYYRRYDSDGMLVAEIVDGAPSLTDKAINLFKAGSRVLQASMKGQKVVVSPEELERRLAICHGCEFFTGTTCKKCGCIARFKAKLATEHCPIEKW
jgi:hypothetical protein